MKEGVYEIRRTPFHPSYLSAMKREIVNVGNGVMKSFLVKPFEKVISRSSEKIRKTVEALPKLLGRGRVR